MSFAEKITFPRVRRAIISYLAAVIVAYVAASIFQSLCVLVTMEQAGAEIPAGDWLRTLWHDLYGFTFIGYAPLGPAILGGFIIAMPTAAMIHKFLGLPRGILYPLAGATAMATILYIVKLNFYGVTIFPGTRGLSGFGLQLLAGAFGGAVFAGLSKSRP
jgi:hypothetical protein